MDTYGARCPGAAEGLTEDRDALLAVLDLPAEHRDHLRTVHTEGARSPATAELRMLKRVTAAARS